MKRKAEVVLILLTLFLACWYGYHITHTTRSETVLDTRMITKYEIKYRMVYEDGVVKEEWKEVPLREYEEAVNALGDY